jgi:DNA polymerase-3 subunit delta'
MTARTIERDVNRHPWLEGEREALNQALDEGRLGHAPMFLGSPGVGKRALAEWLVRRILCLQPDHGQPCGSCHSCNLIETGGHPDLFRLELLEDKNEILVDQVRDFIASLGLTPSVGSRRIGLIIPADRLNRNAANALLKTLEEPSGEVWLVLVTDNEDRLPVTVTSRCQRRYVAVPDRARALDWLCARHGDRDRGDCELALDLADGAPLLADDWLDGAGLELGLAIRDGLAGMISGRADEAALVAQWRETPAESWRWLARFSQLWLHGLLAEPPGVLADAPMPVAGADAAPILEQCWKQALEGTRLAGRPVRHDWLMQSWLTEWRKLASA